MLERKQRRWRFLTLREQAVSGATNNADVAVGTLRTVVATLARTSVVLIVIMQIKDACVLVADILAWFLRSVFNYYHLEVFQRLRT